MLQTSQCQLRIGTNGFKINIILEDNMCVHGKVTVTCCYKNANVNTTVLFVNNNAPPL